MNYIKDPFRNSEDSNIQLISRYMVQSVVNPRKSFVYESLNTLRIGQTIFIDNEPHIVLSRA